MINDRITLPAGELTHLRLYYLDTTRYSFRAKDITDPKLIGELITQLEKGRVTKESYEMRSGINLSVTYKKDYNFDIIASSDHVYVSDWDTSLVLTRAEAFIKKLQELSDWKNYDPTALRDADKVVLKYKNNTKVIKDPTTINTILSCLREAKPTYATKCPFYNGRIYIHIGDKTVSAAPAHDGCSIIIIEKNYFEIPNMKLLSEILKQHVGFEIGP
jgi:hypothetical protein